MKGHGSSLLGADNVGENCERWVMLWKKGLEIVSVVVSFELMRFDA